MEAKDVIDINLIKTNLSFETKSEIIHFLSETLKENDKINDIDGFVSDVYKREEQGQTGIGNFVAIPHGKSKFVNKPSVVIGINEKEIPWESLDGKGVRVVVLFAVGNDDMAAKEHLKLLSIFARKLGNDDVIKNLINSETKDGVIEAFY
ncbi:MAG: fructose PTS transporter subunit IIA [Streptococcus sp.]|nr:fructose PTS transporter subunit IIA [Streptococcus sp.]